MKKLTALFLVLAMVLTLAACGGNTAPAENAAPAQSGDAPAAPEADGDAAEGDKIFIGWSGMFLDEQQTRIMSGGQGFVDANSDRYEMYYVSADNSTEKQLTDVENLIAMGCDIIIIDEIDPICSSACVKMCRDAGVLTCAASTNLTEAADFEFVIDAKMLGAAQGEAVEAWWALNPDVDLKAGLILGTTSQQQTWDTKDGGYAACFQARIDSGDLEMLAEDTADWLTADAVSLVETWLIAYPEMNAIFAQNDDMALGAIQAAKAAGKNLGVDFWVFGKDGSETGRAALAAGEMAASVYLGFEGWGYTEIKMLLEKVEEALATENFQYGQKVGIVLDPETCWQPILPDTVDSVIEYFDGLAAAAMQ